MMNESHGFWNFISRASGGTPQELRGTDLKTLEATRRHLTPEQRVLDFGCGGGDLTTAMAPHVKTVTAIDTSSGMIEVATAKAGQRGLENVTFAMSSIDGVDPAAGTFDLVTAFNVLHYVEETEMVARKISARLSPGGLFISATACVGERRTFPGMLVRLMVALRIMPAIKFFKQSELEALITRGGFQIVETETLTTLPEAFIVARKV